MKLIVGLGNPGVQYEQTRHNAGFMVVDELASRHAVGSIARARFQAATLDAHIGGEKCLLMKPTTFMNLSGRCVGEAVRFFKLEPAEDVLVLTDDVALPVGTIRLRAKGGSGGHNGLSDIDRVLGGEPYARLRVGIGQTPKQMVQADWVLSKFTEGERGDLKRSVSEAAEATASWVDHGIEKAMNAFNKKLSPDANPKGEHPAAKSGDQASKQSKNDTNNESAETREGNAAGR
ncbi:MAG: aminoacyl-tRNA hydrolase [Planctomycetota bacterium]